MKFFNNIFSFIFLLYESLNDGRHGEEMPIIGAISVMTIILSANVLSFIPTNYLYENKWVSFLVFGITCGTLIIYFYRGKHYLKIVSRFKKEENKGIYNFIAIIYFVLTIVVFAITR
jgi:hypothetical protein